MSDELTLKLSSPLTEEEMDLVMDYDLDHTSSIWFHTKHGMDVEFVKRRRGVWIRHLRTDLGPKLNDCIECSECRIWFSTEDMPRRSFCPNCGSGMTTTKLYSADMMGDGHE